MITAPRSRLATLVLAALALSACGGGGGGTAPEVTTGPVTGTLVEGVWDSTGHRTTRVPAAAKAVPPTVAVTALVPAAGGGYDRFPATVSPDGTFAIPGVAPGRYLLELKGTLGGIPRYYEPFGRQVDLGTEVMGVPGAAAASGASFLSLTYGGLDPAATGSILYSVVPGTASVTGVQVGGGVTAGTFAFSAGGASLTDPPQPAWVQQLSTLPAPEPLLSAGADYRVVTRAAPLGAVLQNGATVSESVTLTAPAAFGTLAGAWPTDAFEAWRSQMGTGASDGTHTATVRAVPYAYAGAPTALSPALATLTLPSRLGAVAGSFEFGRYLPATWKEVRTVSYSTSVPVTAPGATSASNQLVSVTIGDPMGAATPIAPRTSPPRRPTIAGRDALVPQTGVGLTPRLAWDAPDLGDTGHYLVNLSTVSLAGTGTSILTAATFRLRSRSLELPAGLLEAGKTYAATVLAVTSPVFDFARPIRTGVPTASAAVATSTFSP